MSINIRPIREIPDSPLEQFANMLAKKVSIQHIKDTLDQMQESDKEDVFSQSTDSETALKFHPEFYHTRKFQFNIPYRPTTDGKYIELWLRGRDLGNKVKDRSQQKLNHINHDAYLYGDPVLVSGDPFDYGIHNGPAGIKSIARRMNRPASLLVNREWIEVPDAQGLRIADIGAGISEFNRFRIYSLEDQAGLSPTVFQKIDDINVSNGRMLQVKSDGRLVFIVNHNGVTYAKESPAGTIVPNSLTTPDLPYEIFTSYDPATHAINIYNASVPLTLSNFTGNVNWQGDKTNFDLFHFRRGYGTTGGYLYGDFYDYKIYLPKVVTSVEVSNHFRNKYSLDSIGLGCVIIANYFTGYSSSVYGSFSPISFSPISFTIRK